MKSSMFLMCACLALIASAPVRAAPGDERYAKPGRIVAVADGARLNLYCSGTGSPVIVFDAGHGDWAPAWATVQPRVAGFTQACSYDRAGVGFSDSGPAPRSAARLAEELHDALNAAGVGGPYILVGHAFGSYPVRAFADRYLREVAGMVLVDPDARDVESGALEGFWNRMYARQLPQLELCRDAVTGGKRLPLAPPPNYPHLTCYDRLFRNLPEPAFSAQLNAKLEEIAGQKAAVYQELIAEMQEMPADDAYLRAHKTLLGKRPLRVISVSHHLTDRPTTTSAEHLEHMQLSYERALADSHLLELSSNAKQTFAQTGAYVQFEQPDLVIAAIREVYELSISRDGS
jgi:pimeloyl-ACP methyl ester carboxylesterase